MSSGWRTATAARDAFTYLTLGTNLGDRIANLRAALEGIARYGTIEALSRVYETEPYGITDQPAFLNMAVRLRTGLDPRSLLGAMKELETAIGRKPGPRMGPRVIDVDIVLFDDLQLDVPGLHIPHRGMMDRAFVLAPLIDIDPQLRHPETGESLRDRLESLDPSSLDALGSAVDVLELESMP